MDTIALMQQLLPHLQSQTQSSTTNLTNFGSPFTQRGSLVNPQYGFIKISPTTAVVDVNTGLPTAAVAETPSNLMAFVSGTAEAALPPEAASTSATPSAPVPSSSNANFASYMAAVQAAAVLQSDAFHSAFRTPFPQNSPSSSQTSSTTTSDSFLTLALSTLVSPGDSSQENSRDDSNSSKFQI